MITSMIQENISYYITTKMYQYSSALNRYNPSYNTPGASFTNFNPSMDK